MRIIGVDASTSATGIVIIDDEQLLFYGAETFKKCNTFWEKCDRIHSYMDGLYKSFGKVDSFFIEEPMKRFSIGMSSAETISTLQRFNGIVCYLTRDVFGVEPNYVNVSAARRACGIKVVQKKKAGGKNAKEQVYEAMMASELSHITWPTKQRSDKIVDWSRDVVDAYVVAKGGMNILKGHKV